MSLKRKHPSMSVYGQYLGLDIGRKAPTTENGFVEQYNNSLLSSFSMFIHGKLVKKVVHSWPMVESALEEHGIECDRSLIESTVTVSTTPRTKDPYMIYKAKRLIELLATTNVSPCMAIDVMNGHRKLYVIKIGNQEGGMCSNFGIKEEEFVQKWKCLFFSLQELTELTLCNIFLNEDTIAAVGISPIGLRLFRTVVEGSIVENLCPATIIKRISKNLQRSLVMGDLEDPHVKHVEEMGLSSFMNKHSMLGAACFCVRFHECQKKKLQEGWPMVESSLENCGISLTLNLAERLMTVSTTRMTEDSDVIYKARDLIEALSADVPLSMAIKIVDVELEHEIIKIGYQNGGLCSKFGIKKEQFARQQRHLQCALEDLATLSQSHLFLHGDIVFALGTSYEKLDLIRKIVKSCIVENANPGALVRKHRKNQLNRELHQINSKIFCRLNLKS